MKFLKAWFSDSNAVSSKRIAGTIGFIIYLVLLISGSHPPKDLADLLYCSVGLMGLGTIDKIVGAKSGNNSYYPYNYNQQ